MLFLFKILIILLPIILSIAFFTILERKVLASIQRRRGPNVVGFFGLLQAFADGLKLLSKETIVPITSNFFIFLLAPVFTFFLSLLGWGLIPFSPNLVYSDVPLGLLALFAISSLNVYGIIMAGWASNSKYAFLGALRSSAQMISYEVSFGILILPIILVTQDQSLTVIVFDQELLPFFIIFLPSSVLFFVSLLAETNRLPFDLPEAESELVSGYNVEYSSLTFALFFLAEYSSIILMSTLFVLMYLGGWNAYLVPFNVLPCFLVLGVKTLFIMILFVWVRGTLPRYRFDQLIVLGWKVILPLSFSYFLLMNNCFLILSMIYV